MTKKLPRSIIVAIVCIALLSIALPAYAASNYTLTTSYTTAAQSTAGLGKYITIQCFNNPYEAQTNDVIMYDKYGKIVWQENGAIKQYGQRTFWCGKNVTVIKVKARVTGWTILGQISGHKGSFNVW